ncbi:hypothetical protein HHX47_DHR10000380 [Lentinula edodes]|nr:hypothetical protein HHX47_DHR10000380 [Lentinula edodes]
MSSEDIEHYFSAPSVVTEEVQDELLAKELAALRMSALEEVYLDSSNDATVPSVINEFQSIEYDEEAEEEEVADFFVGVTRTSDWTPYENKTMCYLDILDNLPRLRLSSSQLKIFLWIMRACGAKDVPSFKALRQAQKKIREDCSVRVQPSKSDFGNLFYTTDIRDIMARDLANPEVAPLIHVYPEDVNGSPISEMWQVPKGRWMELPLDFLTPSILVDNKRHYIHEVAQLKDHHCHVVNKNERGLLTVKMDQVRVSVKELHLTYMELVALNKGELIFEEAFSSFASQIPNCNRAIDNGEDLFTVWLAIWMDDVSGARSKQYQKHVNAYAQISNLPGKFLQHEYSVHFVSTSPFASALEQFKPIVKQLQ